MTSHATTVEQYLLELPAERKNAFAKLRNTILENLPPGFEEEMSYGMVGYVVPHRIYPPGYHCNPKLPLPFASIAAQKNSINFYHMGLYADASLLHWFLAEYPKHCTAKLDMGKSCIRFKKEAHMPFALIGELMRRMLPDQYIALYEKSMEGRENR